MSKRQELPVWQKDLGNKKIYKNKDKNGTLQFRRETIFGGIR